MNLSSVSLEISVLFQVWKLNVSELREFALDIRVLFEEVIEDIRSGFGGAMVLGPWLLAEIWVFGAGNDTDEQQSSNQTEHFRYEISLEFTLKFLFLYQNNQTHCWIVIKKANDLRCMTFITVRKAIIFFISLVEAQVKKSIFLNSCWVCFFERDWSSDTLYGWSLWSLNFKSFNLLINCFAQKIFLNLVISLKLFQ